MNQSDSRVVVYSTRICGYCNAAKHLLKSMQIPFAEIDLTGQDAQRGALVDQYGWRTVPLIVIDGDLVGGYTELSALKRQGGLDHLIPS